MPRPTSNVTSAFRLYSQRSALLSFETSAGRAFGQTAGVVSVGDFYETDCTPGSQTCTRYYITQGPPDARDIVNAYDGRPGTDWGEGLTLVKYVQAPIFYITVDKDP